jgi:hypothetical protein
MLPRERLGYSEIPILDRRPVRETRDPLTAARRRARAPGRRLADRRASFVVAPESAIRKWSLA